MTPPPILIECEGSNSPTHNPDEILGICTMCDNVCQSSMTVKPYAMIGSTSSPCSTEADYG